MTDDLLPTCLTCGYDCRRLVPGTECCPECATPRGREREWLAQARVACVVMLIGSVAAAIAWGISSAVASTERGQFSVYTQRELLRLVPSFVPLATVGLVVRLKPRSRAGEVTLGCAGVLAACWCWQAYSGPRPTIPYFSTALSYTIILLESFLLVVSIARLHTIRATLDTRPVRPWTALMLAPACGLGLAGARISVREQDLVSRLLNGSPPSRNTLFTGVSPPEPAWPNDARFASWMFFSILLFMLLHGCLVVLSLAHARRAALA